MKQLLILCNLLIAFAAVSAQSVSGSIEFTERVYSFGSIRELDGKVSHTFLFRNKGTAPVVISDIHSACGCIGKVVTQNAVPPGGEGKVTITFDPSYKEGFFSKEIVVLSNNNQEYNRIWVEGSIIPGIRPVADEYPYSFGSNLHLRYKVMALGYMRPGEIREMDLHYANDNDREIDLQFKVNGPAGMVTFSSPGKIGAKARGVMKVRYQLPWQSMQDEKVHLVPIVNGQALQEQVEVKALNDLKWVKTPGKSS